MTLEIALMIVGVLIAIVGIISGITSIWLVVEKLFLIFISTTYLQKLSINILMI